MKKAFFITFFFILIEAQLSSGLMLGMHLRSLAAESELIVRGRVHHIECHWSEDKTAILSVARIEIRELIAGVSPGRSIEVTWPGGQIGDIAMKQSDEPEFFTHEDVLLFLHQPDIQTSLVFRVVGKAQGKYSIDKNDIARKGGFTVPAPDAVNVENQINVQQLIKKIHEAR
ncbi:MAG: hypothetical protein WCQ99_03530 [Pseudomonadota bacterium]